MGTTDRARRCRRTAAVLPGLLLAVMVITGCQDIPEDASKSAFCTAGQRFSALQKVPFSQGREAVDKLAEVGTPSDIDPAAREGFVELIERMNDSEDAGDFRRRTATMDKDERAHLLALDTYIQGACSDRVPSNASRADFCSAGQAFAKAQNDDASFPKAKEAVAQLVKIGTPENMNAAARLGFIELIDRMNSSTDAPAYDELTRTINPTERDHLDALDAYIKKTCR